MKATTSSPLSEATLAGVRRANRRGESRPETIERLLRDHLADQAARGRRARGVAQINEHAEALNAEAADVLTYPGDL
jgi:hypothetical protein